MRSIRQRLASDNTVTLSGADDRTRINSRSARACAAKSNSPGLSGGLIRENETNGRNGVPVLSNLPVVGALFGNTTNNSNRTELLVLLTPRALENDDELRAASAELRDRMRSLSLESRPFSGVKDAPSKAVP